MKAVNIKYLQRSRIDTAKWDQCISNSPNGLIYGYSFYLDHMARNWDALVMNDYDAVMPLTWNKKYGIHYLYQPFLTAQLGLFGKDINAALMQEFLDCIPSHFKLLDIYLNHGNLFSLKGYALYQRSNYILRLDQPYEDLYEAYRENIKRNIKKTVQLGCAVKRDFNVEEVISLAVEQMRDYGKESEANVDRFRKLYSFLHQQKMATTYGIVGPKEELLASCVFFFSHTRAFYILVGNHPNGKTIGASHALIDAFIKDHAGSNMVLDFEGSDISSLAFFYSSFGAVLEPFAGLNLNRLPRMLKWFKS